MIHDEWQQHLGAAHDAAAGLAYLPRLGAARFEGADAARFLQGYLTCDTADLALGRLVPTALCNLKGRVVMNGWCTLDGDDASILVVLHRSLIGRLGEFLERYLKFSRTTFVDASDDTLLLASLDLPDLDGGLALDARRRLFPAVDLAQAKALWEAHPHIAEDAWLASLTADAIPLISAPVSERFLPQMLDLERLGAVDFEKGCYLGQEVVARAQHRGEVKRRLIRLDWRGGSPPEPGSDVTDDGGRTLGTVVQSAGAQSGPLLAVLARELPHVLRQGDSHLSVRS